MKLSTLNMFLNNVEGQDTITAPVPSVGNPLGLIATVEPENAMDKTVEWSITPGSKYIFSPTGTNEHPLPSPTGVRNSGEIIYAVLEGSTGIGPDTRSEKATITVTTTDGGKTATCDIGKTETTISTPPTAGAITYGQTLSEIALTGGAASVAGTFDWKDGTIRPSVADSGTAYRVVFTPEDTTNFARSACSVPVTVNKADPAYTVPTSRTATYGQTLADVALPAGWTWNDALTTSVGNAGTNKFKATFTPIDAANYNTMQNVDVSVEVKKREVTVTAKPQTVKKGGSITMGVEQAELSGALSGHTLSEVTLSATSTASVTTTGTITPSGAKIADASGGDVTDNYKISYKPGTLTVTDKTSLTGLTVSIKGWTYGEYDETVNSPSVSGNAGGGAVSYTYKSMDAAGSVYSTDVPIDAGNWSVMAVVAESGDYASGTATAEFTIAKADAKVTTSPSEVTGLVYDAEDHALINPGETKDGTMQYSLDGTNYKTAIPTGREPGKYSVYWKIVGDNNHKDKTAEQPLSVTIDKWAKDATNSGKPSAPETTYDASGSRTKTETVFTEPWKSGSIFASVDITITTESTDLTGKVGEPFSTPVVVSVDIEPREDYKYTNYTLSLDVSGPGWLKTDDKMLYENVPLTSRDFTLTLTGTPREAVAAKAVKIAATVTVKGTQPTLTARADKTVTLTVSEDVKPDPESQPEPGGGSAGNEKDNSVDSAPGGDEDSSGRSAPEPHELSIGDKTVPYIPLEKAVPALTEKVRQKLSELLGALPLGTKFFADLTNMHFLKSNGLNSFIESIIGEEKESTRKITAILTPVQIDEAGVYFMKVMASDDQKEAMKGGYDLQYHVTPYSPDVDVKAAVLTDAEASDGSKGILVDANGEKLGSSAYDGEKQLYVLACFEQANTPYAQYLTMEASRDVTVPTSNKDGGGCDAGLGIIGLAAALPPLLRRKHR